MIKEIYIYTNGVLVSRRLITKEDGTPITPYDIADITLRIYILEPSNGQYTRKLVDTKSLAVTDVITTTVQTDPQDIQYNFNYCIENAFTSPNTLYLAEYTLTAEAGHKITVVAKGRTMD